MTNYSDVTRWLCASTITMGQSFRETLKRHYRNRHTATALEISIDITQLMQVVAHLDALQEQRDEARRRFGWWFFGLALAVVVALALLPQIAWLVLTIVWLSAIVLQWLTMNQIDAIPSDDDLLDHFRQDRYDPERVLETFSSNMIADEIASGLPRPDQNVIVYSGYTPFVGVGISLGGWSFATNITNGREDFSGTVQDPIPFDVPELYTFIADTLGDLQLPEISVKDMLFVNGRDIRDDEIILPNKYDRPRQTLTEEEMAPYINRSDPRIRHYQWIRISYANETLVLSFFVRFSIRGNNLFSEFTRYLLTPPEEAYRELDDRVVEDDEEDQPAWSRFMSRATAAIFTAPFSVIGGAFYPLFVLSEWRQKRTESRTKEESEEEACERIDDNPRYNWGVSSSIRQIVSSSRFDHYFQQLDRDMYYKIVERTILDGIFKFLSDHQINTDDFKERRTTILNSGVMVQGGNIEAGALAVGEGSSASQTNVESSEG